MPSELLTFVLGVIASVIAAIGLDLFRYYFFRPRLVIQDERPEDAATYSCHSLMVRNVGRRVALHAQGAISFETIEASDIIPNLQLKLGRDLDLDPEKFGVSSPETVYLREGVLRQIDDEPLCWAAVDSRNSIDLYPTSGRLLDVCRFIKVKDHHQIHIPSALGWQALLIVLRPRNYRVWIIGPDYSST